MQTIMPEAQLLMDNDLLMELSNRSWKMDTKGRRAVESKDDYKKRGYRSPDKADATILCFYTPQVPQAERPRTIF
jgi:phage terminase large subunit